MNAKDLVRDDGSVCHALSLVSPTPLTLMKQGRLASRRAENSGSCLHPNRNQEVVKAVASRCSTDNAGLTLTALSSEIIIRLIN